MEYLLRAADRAQMMAALVQAGVIRLAGSGSTDQWVAALGFEVAIIGEVFSPVGQAQVLDIDGERVYASPMEKVEGFHARVLGPITPEQESILPIATGQPVSDLAV